MNLQAYDAREQSDTSDGENEKETSMNVCEETEQDAPETPAAPSENSRPSVTSIPKVETEAEKDENRIKRETGTKYKVSNLPIHRIIIASDMKCF